MKLKIILGAVIVIFAGVLFGGAISKKEPQITETKNFGSVNNAITFFSATTTNATSTTANINANIQGAKRATLYFSRGDKTGTGNAGSSLFHVEASRTNSTSDADWIDY